MEIKENALNIKKNYPPGQDWFSDRGFDMKTHILTSFLVRNTYAWTVEEPNFSLNHPEPPGFVLKRPAITAVSTGLHCLAANRPYTCLMRFPVSHDPKTSRCKFTFLELQAALPTLMEILFSVHHATTQERAS